MAAANALKKWLENDNVCLEKRLQMAEKLYRIEIISLPSKSQIIFYWICDVITHQKRYKCKNTKLLWFVAKQIFQKKIISRFKITFSSRFIKALIKYIKSDKPMSKLSKIISCVSTIVENTSLAPDFLREFDSYISLFEIVIEKLSSVDYNKELISLFNMLVDHLAFLQKQHINQQQVLNQILKSVLTPYIHLTKNQARYSCDEFNASVNNLTNVLYNILYHRDSITKFENFLRYLLEENTSCPEDTENILNIMLTFETQDEKSQIQERLSFIFEGYLKKTKEKNLGILLLFVLLQIINVNILNVPWLKKIKSHKRDQLEIIHSLLSICCTHDTIQVQKNMDSKFQPSVCFEKLLNHIYEKLSDVKSAIWFNTVNLLLNLNIELVTRKIELSWIHLFFSVSHFDDEAVLAQNNALVNIFEVFTKLHLLPKLFIFLFNGLKKISFIENPFLPAIEWPSPVLAKFSSCCEKISTAQYLSIWKVLLMELKSRHNFLKENLILTTESRHSFNLCLSLLSTLLLHCRIAEESVPDNYLNEAQDLLTNTGVEIKNLLASFVTNWKDDKICASILSVCYSWRELSLLLQKYNRINPSASKTDPGDSALDFSYLYLSFSDKDCEELKKFIENANNVKLTSLFILLEIQRIKVVTQDNPQLICQESSSENKSGLSLFDELQQKAVNIATVVIKQLEEFQTIECKSDDRVFMWCTFLSSFSLLSTFWSPKILKDVVNLMIDILCEPSSVICTETRIIISRSNTFMENKLLQSTVISVLLERMKQLIGCDVSDPVHSLFTVLTDSFENWLSEANTIPLKEKTVIWSNIEKAGKYFQQMCSQTPSKNVFDEPSVESIFKHTQVFLQVVPLQYLLSGNLTRCMFCMLGILYKTGNIENSLMIKIAISCYRILIYMFEGRRSIWFLDFTNSPSLLSWFMSNAANNLQLIQQADVKKEFQSLYQSSFTKFLQLVTNNRTSFIEAEQFITDLSTLESFNSLNSEEENGIYLITFNSVLKVLTQIRQRPQVSAEINGLCLKYLSFLSPTMLKLLKFHHFYFDSPSKSNTLFLSSYGLITRTCVNTSSHLQKWKKFFPHAILYAEKLAVNKTNLNTALEDNKKAFEDILTFFHSVLECWTTSSDPENADELVLHIFTIIKMAFENIHSNDMLFLHNTGRMENWVNLMKFIIVNIFIKCTNEALNNLLKELNMIMSNNSSERITPAFSFLLACCYFIPVGGQISENKQKLFIVSNYINKLLFFFVSELNKIDINNRDALKHFTLPALTVINHFLTIGKVSLSHDSVILCFQIFCIIEPFGKITDNELFSHLMASVYEMLNALIVNFQLIILKTNLPIYIHGINGFLRALVAKSDQSILKHDEDVFYLLTTSQNLNRLLSLLSTHKQELQRIAPFIIIEYIDALQNTIVLPIIKETLIMGLQNVLALCDEHAFGFLHCNIPPHQKELLKYILFSYEKHSKTSNKSFKKFKKL